ncbi:MAG: hypothetical protein ACRDRL_24005, partial [Sciscionella sp.]
MTVPPPLHLEHTEAHAIRQARENLMSTSLLERSDPTSVSDRIQRSWRRSIVNGIVAGRNDRLPEPDDYDHGSPLLRAAGPVLDRLAEQVSGLPVCVILADDKSRIVDRRVGDTALRAALDRVHAIEGSPYAEEVVGTNGIGTALEDSGPAVVRGSEHFVDFLQDMTCAGFPIRNPLTARAIGVVVLACRAAHAHDLMGVLAAEASRSVEARFIEGTSRREQALLRRFLDRSRRGEHAVVVLNEDLILSNSRAAALLGPADHALLWEYATRAAGSGSRRPNLELAGGKFNAAVDEVTCDRRVAGFYVRLSEAAPPRATRAAGKRQLGRSPAWPALTETLGRAAASGSPVAIVGGPGSGKLYLAKYLHSLRQGAPDLYIVDNDAPHAGVSATISMMLDEARAVLARGGTVVWRHIERDSSEARWIVADLPGSGGGAGQVIVTSTSAGSGRPDALLARIPVVVEVPDLCLRADDIPGLIRALLQRHALGDRTLTSQ